MYDEEKLSWAEQARLEAKRQLGQNPSPLGHYIAENSAPTLKEYMEGTPNGFDIRGSDPSFNQQTGQLYQEATVRDLEDDTSEEIFAENAPISIWMAGPWTLYGEDEFGYEILLGGYEPIIEDQYLTADKTISDLEQDRTSYCSWRDEMNKAARRDAAIFKPNGDKQPGADEFIHYRRSKTTREERTRRILEFIKTASIPSLHRVMPKMKQKLTASRKVCFPPRGKNPRRKTRHYAMAELFLTKAQETVIRKAVNTRIQETK